MEGEDGEEGPSLGSQEEQDWALGGGFQGWGWAPGGGPPPHGGGDQGAWDGFVNGGSGL